MEITGLAQESLYLCISIIDRFLSNKCVPRKRLQLLGVASLLIACKYEETRQIFAGDFAYFIDLQYTRQDLLTMELHIVKIIDYKLTVPTGYAFLQRFLHVTGATGVAANLASFYMERMLLEYSALEFRPSHLAAAAVALALNNPDLPRNKRKLKMQLEYIRAPTIPGVVRTVKEFLTPHRYASILTFLCRLSSPNYCWTTQAFQCTKS
jgi:hypothetical protein